MFTTTHIRAPEVSLSVGLYSIAVRKSGLNLFDGGSFVMYNQHITPRLRHFSHSSVDRIGKKAGCARRVRRPLRPCCRAEMLRSSEQRPLKYVKSAPQTLRRVPFERKVP